MWSMNENIKSHFCKCSLKEIWQKNIMYLLKDVVWKVNVWLCRFNLIQLFRVCCLCVQLADCVSVAYFCLINHHFWLRSTLTWNHVTFESKFIIYFVPIKKQLQQFEWEEGIWPECVQLWVLLTPFTGTGNVVEQAQMGKMWHQIESFSHFFVKSVQSVKDMLYNWQWWAIRACKAFSVGLHSETFL